jgi:hypothetical protein
LNFANAERGVLVVLQPYHGLIDSSPLNMIDAALESHFCVYRPVLNVAMPCHSCGSAAYAIGFNGTAPQLVTALIKFRP